MYRDLDMAIYRGDCPRCNEKLLLFIPKIEVGTVYLQSSNPHADKTYHNWNYLCGNCMDEIDVEIDIEATSKNLGNTNKGR